MLLEDVTSREHTRMNSLGPCCVEFLVKLVRTALMCKFNINPSESSLLPVPAYRLGLSPSQQDLLGVCTILMSVVAGGNLLFACLWAGVSWCSTWGSASCCSSKWLAQLTGLLGKDHNPRQLCNRALRVFIDWLQICYFSEVQWRGKLVLKQ